MSKIKVEEILKKHIPQGIINIKGKGDGKPQYRAEIDVIKAVIKEIVEKAIDKCAEKSSVSFREAPHVDVRYKVDKQSILNVKNMIDYE